MRTLWIFGVVIVWLLAPPALQAQSVYRCPQHDAAAVLSTERRGPECEVAAAWQPDVARVADGEPINRRLQPLGLHNMESTPASPSGRPARVYPTAYAEEIELHARRFGVDPSLIRAVIHAESTFNPRAVSPKGAMGLMQLMPATARRFGVQAAFDPAQNIAGGVQYLAWLLRRYRGDWRLAIAGYNAGEGAVDRYGGVPPYRETRDYLQKVWRLSQSYRQLGTQ